MDIPLHVAVIMDGNGRWAQKKGNPRREGHKRGVNTLKDIVEASMDLGISCLTVFAFSTENWKRPDYEVNFLMKLFQKTLDDETEELNQNNVKINVIGRRKKLPQNLINKINKSEKITENNDGLILNIAYNYGGRAEIIDAAKKLYRDLDDKFTIDELDEKKFQNYLYCSQYSDVELLIRTGGEKRVSNFLLWEIAYSEIYITDKFWPEFTKNDFKLAIKKFQNRDRRFGGIK